MRKPVKWILGIVLVVVVLAVVGVVAVLMSLNGIIRATVECESTESLNLETHLGAANLSLLGRKLDLSDLRIAAPQGYDQVQLMSLDDIGVQVRIRELRQDPVRIAEINLQRPMLVIEQRGTQINLRTAMDQMPPTEDPLRLIIGRLRVHDAQVRLHTDLPGLAGQYNVTLPQIELMDIGIGEDHENGAAIRDVVMQLASAMASVASESDQIPPELQQLLDMNIGEIVGQLSAEARARVEAATGELRERVGEHMGEILEDPSRILEDPGEELDRRVRDLRTLDPRRPREEQPQPPPE